MVTPVGRMDPAALHRALLPHRDRLLTPALVIDLDAAEHNARAMAERAGPSRWRPHVKTLKQSALVGVLLDVGVRHFKCATVDELDLVLRTASSRTPDPVDVLVAYPPSRPTCEAILAVQARESNRRHRVQLLLDSTGHARAVDAWVREAAPHEPVDAMLDVNLGMDRTGSAPEQWQRDASRLDPLTHLRITGLHGYDGHFTWDQRDAAHRAFDELCGLARILEPLQFLVTSGTHGYAHALAYSRFQADDTSWTHQVSPGTLVLSDLRSQDAAEDLDLRQAAFVATRVISAPTIDRITLDAGSKAIAPDMPAPSCAVVGHRNLEPLTASEEHRPVRVTKGVAPEVGDMLFLVPEHVCTTVNLYRRAVYLRDGGVIGDGPVEAMAHSLWRDDWHGAEAP